MFITDATGSMGAFLNDLKLALPQIFDLVQLTNLVDRVSVLAFRDYCDDNLIEWSGWASVDEAETLSSFVEKLVANGGGDNPEAVKTGLIEASKKVEKPTICIFYGDAPPHHKYKDDDPGENYKKEVEALGKENFDWLTICEKLRDKKMRIYPIMRDLNNYSYPFFASLAEITGGQFFSINHSSIVRNTIGVLLNLAGVEFEHDPLCNAVQMPETYNQKKILKNDSGRFSQAPKFLRPKIVAINEVKARIGNPINRFQTSEDYKNLVFRVFERLLTPTRVMAFTYNTLFGKLWREICKQRKDPRRERLMAILSQSVTAVSESDRVLLQTFLDETYDQTAEIEEIVEGYGDKGPFYVIDHDQHLARKTLYEIGLSCAPFAVSAVRQLLTGLRVANRKPEKRTNLTYIPVNMEPGMKFNLLPHLIRPGTMFSMRLSAIMATIAKISGSILQDDAVKCLNDWRGKWIDFTLPENNSMDFARLMLKVAKEALMEDEINHLRALLFVGSLKKSKARDIEVEIAYSSYKTKRADYKDQCKTCKQWRSTTLLLDESCAFCVIGEAELYPEPQSDSSWMCECRKCLVHYAVYKVEDLKCNAKCHFCRLGEVAPYVECKECQNKFLYQQSKAVTDFTCAVCKNTGGKVGQKRKTTIEKYITRNGAGFIGMQIDGVSKFFDDGNKVFKMSAEERLAAVRNFAEITDEDLSGHKFFLGEASKSVWNVKNLQQQINEIFVNPHLSQCMICFQDIAATKVRPICGRVKKGCSVEACNACLETWYNQMAPGQICQPAQLVCPYCKQVPLIKIVAKFNKQLCTLMNATDVSTFDPSFIHAWCKDCYEIKEAMQRECGGENPVISNFKCDNCKSKFLETAKESNCKKCPKCKVMTEKVGGCNHITCPSCDAHWCWVCQALSTYEDIYRHLSNEHGGFFDNEEAEDHAEDDL